MSSSQRGDTGAVPQVSPELPGPAWRALLSLLGRLPQASLSRAFARLADLRIPRPLRAPVLDAFARSVGIDLSEVELPLSEYATLDDFFVRRLRAGVRPVSYRPDLLLSPVDGVAGECGELRGDQALQAKGRPYSVARLLDDEEQARRYDDGLFLTFYLSPRHYHRIHAPAAGEIRLARHVPGALLPVNRPAVLTIAELFPRNERLVCYSDGVHGRVAVVAIGAFNVGRISAAFDPSWGPRGTVTNRAGARAETRTYDPPRTVRAGEEIMGFHLGSTVVLLIERGSIALSGEVAPGREVRLGEIIGRAAPRS